MEDLLKKFEEKKPITSADTSTSEKAEAEIKEATKS